MRILHEFEDERPSMLYVLFAHHLRGAVYPLRPLELISCGKCSDFRVYILEVDLDTGFY